MRRTVVLLLLVMLTMLVVAAAPALARPTHIFFVPPQEGLPPDEFPGGVTGRCTDTTDPIDAATCVPLHPGPPKHLVCNTPVTIVVTQAEQPFSLSAFRCHTTPKKKHHHEHHRGR